MKILDDNGNIIENPDLSIGELQEETVIKKDAVPIDNISKFAWDDEDYEKILRYHIWTNKDILEKIDYDIGELKGLLLDTDYITSKAMDSLMSCKGITEFFSVLSSFNEKYRNVIIQRQQWRDKINELEQKIGE